MRSFRRLLPIQPGLVVVALAGAFLFLPFAFSQATDKKTPEPSKAHAPPPSTAIPLADVATRATEVSTLLRTFNTQLAPSPEIETIQERLPEVSEDVALGLLGTMNILRGQPALETIQAQQNLWQGRQLELSKWLNLLTQRATQLQRALTRLAELQKTWNHTLDAAQASKAPGQIIEEIKAVLAAVEEAQTPLQAQRTAVVDLQSRVAQAVAQCGTALSEIAQTERKAVGGLLTRESLPVWSASLWARARTEGLARIRQNVADRWAEIEQYVHDPSQGMPAHIGLFVALVLLSWVARRQVHRWEAAGSGSFAIKVFDYPYATALIASLLVASSPYLPPPPTVRDLFQVLVLVPIIRLIRPAVDPRVVPELYALSFLFAFDAVRQVFAGTPILEQAIIALEVLAGMAVLGSSLAFGRLRRSLTPATGLARPSPHRVAAGLILLVLAIGMAAGVLGYMRLARLLVSGVLIGGALAMALAASVQILGGVAAFALRVWPLRLLYMVQHHREMLERRTHRVLVWLAILGWLSRWLDYIGLLQPALSLGEAALGAKLERGSISISVGDILAFILTVWVAYLLSAFIRFVLQEDVYPKKGIPRGSSYAISSLLHYLVLALGVVVGLGVLGVNLNRVTVLIGAFGVGIGFGLQSVVNNFVSGLILLFERPIHVGDAVEIGDLLGEVRRIGIRATTVRTWQGADIVVPNAQLTTAQVTNWTLGDRLRRIDLPVGVNYAAAPQKVIEVIEAAARAHPQVLRHPPPQGLFVGYGDSSINFELRAWTDEFEQWQQIRSDLAAALYDAVHAAGMQFPFPQREVRLLRDPDAGPTVVPAAGVFQPPRPEGRAEAAPGKKGETRGPGSAGHPAADEGGES